MGHTTRAERFVSRSVSRHLSWPCRVIAATPSLLSMTAARVFDGIGWAGAYMTCLKLLADSVDGKLMSRATAGHAASIGIAGALSFASPISSRASQAGKPPSSPPPQRAPAWLVVLLRGAAGAASRAAAERRRGF